MVARPSSHVTTHCPPSTAYGSGHLWPRVARALLRPIEFAPGTSGTAILGGFVTLMSIAVGLS
jgi:hypothetical protein